MSNIGIKVAQMGLFLSLGAAVGLTARGAELGSNNAKNPRVAAASNEGELAIKKFKIPAGFKVDLIAAEPLLANPVSFAFDEQGKIYVVETYRHFAGVLDIRGRIGWPNAQLKKDASAGRMEKLSDEVLDADLANNSVDVREGMLRKYFGTNVFPELNVESDQIRLLVDKDGDGKMDSSTIFATGFNRIPDGLAAGVAVRRGSVYFANIPDVWLLKDSKGTGTADFRKSLSHGYGVHAGFLGHDLHGLKIGPDGRVYFTIGDRGANVKLPDGSRVGFQDGGAIYRSELDGSNLEMFAFGVRNPQELAFDQYGNLFTGDNNSDSGDQARWVYVVDGGDSGWRTGYQYMEGNYSRGPFNAEKVWYPQRNGQPAHIVPPIANIANGPSGVSYNPGTGMPDQYKEHFFLVDFKGAAANSGVHSFAMKPKGASFEMVDRDRFIWNILATDADIGPAGGMYVLDWTEGWNKTGKGRLYRVYNPDTVASAIVQQTKKIIAEDFTRKTPRELAKLLRYLDMRVRQEAQFELVSRGWKGLDSLIDASKDKANPLARLHGVWGLGQLARQNGVNQSGKPVVESLVALLKDSESEVRVQAAKMVGESKNTAYGTALIPLLADAEPRVRFAAAIAVGRLQVREAQAAVLAMLRENADQDVYLRHAGVMALAGIHDYDTLTAAITDPSAAVRMASLLAMRRLEFSEISKFLKDKEPAIVLEAARAINDQPVNAAMPDLADLLARNPEGDFLIRRVLNANFRNGRAENARLLAAYAGRSDALTDFRAMALQLLAEWPKPSGRDKLVGLWRPLDMGRDVQEPANALKPVSKDLLADGAPDEVRIAAANAFHALQIKDAAGALATLAKDLKASPKVRAAALRGLEGLDDAKLLEVLPTVANDESETVRKEALKLQAKVQSAGALGNLSKALDGGSASEKQGAFASLAKIDGAQADALIARWVGELTDGKVEKEVALDVVLAASKRTAAVVKSALAKYTNSLPKDDQVAGFRETLYGGNAAEGRKIFYEKAEASCLRCHKAGGEGGEAGPDLSKAASRVDRLYILESILYPNRKIAEGFETSMITTKAGQLYAGIQKKETDTELTILSPEDGVVTIKKADIKERTRGPSGMPEGFGQILSREEIRNLVEFLGTMK